MKYWGLAVMASLIIFQQSLEYDLDVKPSLDAGSYKDSVENKYNLKNGDEMNLSPFSIGEIIYLPADRCSGDKDGFFVYDASDQLDGADLIRVYSIYEYLPDVQEIKENLSKETEWQNAYTIVWQDTAFYLYNGQE